MSISGLRRSGTIEPLGDMSRPEKQAVITLWQEIVAQPSTDADPLHGPLRAWLPSSSGSWSPSSVWTRSFGQLIQGVQPVMPAENVLSPVGEDLWTDEVAVDSGAIAFLEQDRQDCGPLPVDEIMLGEIDRLRRLDVNFLGRVRPAFWWLEVYGEFRQHLRPTVQCIVESERLVAFDLRL